MIKNLMWEFRKIFIKQKIIYCIFFLLLIETASLFPALRSFESFQNEEIKQYYLSYVEKLEGPLTSQTIDFVNEEIADTTKQIEEVNSSQENYINKKIDAKTYQSLLALQPSLEAKYEALQLLQALIDSQNEVPTENRYISHTAANQALLLQNPNYIFSFFLILFVIAVFFTDHDSEMDLIINTSISGYRHTRRIKLAIVVISTILLGIFTELLTYMAVSLQIDAPSLSYPIQSVLEYADCAYHLSIGDAYLIQTGIKLLGYVLLALFLSVLADRIKKIPLLFGMAIFLGILPILLFSKLKLFFFNLLWGGMLPQMYLCDSLKTDDIIYFEKFSTQELILTATLTFFSFVILLRFLSLKRRSKKLFPIFSLLLLLLSGCGQKNINEYENDILLYKYDPIVMHEISNDQLYIKDVDTYHHYDITSGKMNDFDHDILHSFHDSEIRSVIPTEHNIYYLRVKNLYNFDIVKREKETNHETILYSDKTYKTQTDTLLPFFTKTYDIPKEGQSPQSFFLWEHDIYVIYHTYVEQINPSTNTRETILEDISQISFYKSNIYYIDIKNNLKQYDMKTGKESILFPCLTDNFKITEAGIYFSNLNDYQHLYVYSFSDKAVKRLVNKRITEFSVNQNIMAYILDDQIALYNLTDQRAIKKIDKTSVYNLKLLDNTYMLFNDHNDQLILYNYNEDKEIKLS